MELKLGLLGGGLIGQSLAESIRSTCKLSCLVDPTPAGSKGAEILGLPLYDSVAEAKLNHDLDAVIVATASKETLDASHAAIDAGLPVLIIPSRGTSLEASRSLVEKAKAQGVILAVGNSRRFHPAVQAAKREIESGRLGVVVSAHLLNWFPKPAAYFSDINWSSKQGHGPILNELIDDLDVLRYLFGEVVEIGSMPSNRVIDDNVVDSVVFTLRFQAGVLVTVNASDVIVSPLSWALTSGDSEKYSHTNESNFWIGGTQGSISLPQLSVWSYGDEEPSWTARIQCEQIRKSEATAQQLEVANFCKAVAGEELLLCGGEDALKTLELIERIYETFNN